MVVLVRVFHRLGQPRDKIPVIDKSYFLLLKNIFYGSPLSFVSFALYSLIVRLLKFASFGTRKLNFLVEFL